MGLDVLILDSGEWILGDELPAEPWHVLIYRQPREPLNELHVWLPRAGRPRSGDYAFRRYWLEAGLRWCVEIPTDPDRLSTRTRVGRSPLRLRFTAPDGRVLWADYTGSLGLGDFSDAELARLRGGARPGPFSRI